jgi:ribosomal protein S18 acetylase RimI-like enzyme
VVPALAVAPLGIGDRDAARVLLGGERAAELLERSYGGTPECRALAAVEERSLAGVVLFGAVAGAAGTGALLWLAVRPERRRRGIGSLLLQHALAALDGDGARLVVAELPHEPQADPAEALLASRGFAVEGEVPDYFRDGVALRIGRSTRR